MSSIECTLRLDDQERAILLNLARQSVENGILNGSPFRPNLSNFSPNLQAPGACFVTLHLQRRLRGCIGSLRPCRALVADVAEHAWAAAFEDPRFDPVSKDEVSELEIHISVLSEPVPIECQSERELIAQLRPDVDGLVLEDGPHRATFLPAVWADLPEPGVFLNHLKRKASLPLDHWSETLKFYRYTTESFPD